MTDLFFCFDLHSHVGRVPGSIHLVVDWILRCGRCSQGRRQINTSFKQAN